MRTMKKSLLLVGLLTAGVATAQYSEDFESVSTPNLPTGWTQNTAATDGGFQTTTDYTSQYFQFDPHLSLIHI